MNIEQYSIISDNSHLFYEFQSIGPKGIINKAVLYSKIKDLNGNFYNLSFGDWDVISGRLDDKIISNNNDTKKVLNTVAFTALQFGHYFPEAYIIIVGSTDPRTRLYQMAIGRNITEIAILFEILGLKNGRFIKFSMGINFEAFLVKNKLNKL
jgi:hypothetical protein